jgi:hypothetical protein
MKEREMKHFKIVVWMREDSTLAHVYTMCADAIEHAYDWLFANPEYSRNHQRLFFSAQVTEITGP